MAAIYAVDATLYHQQSSYEFTAPWAECLLLAAVSTGPTHALNRSAGVR